MGVSSARPRHCMHWCSCREWQLCLGAIAELEESMPSSQGLAFPDSELKLTMYLPLSLGSCEVLLIHPQRGRKIKGRQNFSISPRCALGTKKASEPLQKNQSKQSQRMAWPWHRSSDREQLLRGAPCLNSVLFLCPKEELKAGL